MSNRILLALLVAAAIALTACGKTEEPAEEAAAPETGAVEEAMDTMKEGGKEAAEATSQMATSAMEKGGEMADAAMEKGGEMVDAAVAKAEELIQQVKDYIANGDFDLAGKAMEQLRAIKDSLPESLQTQIDNLEQMLSSSEGAAMPAQGQQ